MKRLSRSREGTLKGLLLLALVANLTWEPLTNHFSEVELSSTQASDPNRRCADKNDERCKAVPASDREKMAQEAARIRAEVGASTGGKTTAAPDVSSETEAKVTEDCKDCVSAEDQAKIAKLNEEIKAITEKTVSTDDSIRSTEFRDTKVSVARIRNCEITEDGDSLTDMEELKCQSKLLASLKEKGDSSRRKEVTRKIEDLIKNLRKDAKEDVFARDSDRRNRGERTISDLIATLGSIRFDRDSERTEMIESLEALRAGADARVVAADLEEDVSDLESEMKSSYKDLNKLTREFQNSCRTRTGCDRDVYEQIQDQNERVSELREEHYELAQTISEEQEDATDSLEDYRDSMTRSELRDYTSPFAKLKSRMDTLKDARKMQASTSDKQPGIEAVPGQDSTLNGFPSDFYDVRGGNSALRRGNGMFEVPQNSQVPMGSPQAINNQMMQQPYSPQYMQPGMQQGMIPGQGQSLLPAPTGMGMNPMMGVNSQIPGQVSGMGAQIVPVPGQYGQQQFGQQFGQPQFGQQQYSQPFNGGGAQILPVPRY